MSNGWIVVREEKHIDDKFWVCQTREDALVIAAAVTVYWREQYDPQDVDETLYGTQVFHYDAEDCFRVYVVPQMIRATGEVAVLGEDA